VAYNEQLASRLRAILAAQPAVEEKKMFGGVSFMVNDQMCCGVLKDDLIVRIGEERNDEALAKPHVRPFDFSGRPMVGMVYVGVQALDSDQALRGWVELGLDYVKAHPKAEKRAGSKARKR